MTEETTEKRKGRERPLNTREPKIVEEKEEDDDRHERACIGFRHIDFYFGLNPMWKRGRPIPQEKKKEKTEK